MSVRPKVLCELDGLVVQVKGGVKERPVDVDADVAPRERERAVENSVS